MKLNLICSQKNSGGAGIPRNIGMKISRAEYITFVDSDDAITPTALEELYTLAKKFDADVVACEKYFELHGKNITPYSYITGDLVQKPTLLTKNFFDRVASLNRKEFIFSLCMKLIRKKFLIEENLDMINIAGEDALFTWCMVCAAEKYLLIPNITYIYRIHDESSSHGSDNLNVEKRVKKWFRSITEGFKYLDNFLLTKDFFCVNSEARYFVLDALIKEFTSYFIPLYAQIPAPLLDGLIRRELEKINDQKALTAFLFARMNIFNLQLNRQNQIIHQQYAQIQQLQAQLKALKS